MIDNLEVWALQNGYLSVNQCPNSQIVGLLENPFNAQIIVGDEFTVDERYTYSTLEEACYAYILWNAVGFVNEPLGWIRHQPSNRRRPDGDPSREEVRP